MTDARVAKRYARALFAAAKRLDVLNSVEEDLEAVSKGTRGSETTRKFLLDPKVPRGQKLEFLEKVYSDRVTALTMQFIRLLMNKRREDLLELIRLEYVDLRRHHDKVVHVTIVSATPLDEGQKSKIVAKISLTLGRTVEPEYDLDDSLIGGVKVMYEDFVLDGSVRGALERLRDQVVYDLLHQTQS